MRCAIYARMSTDKQSADSPADQIARCRTFAASRGWTVVPELVVEDAGVSGASRHNRPKLLELMARIPEWDVLLCWEFSRLARDSEDLGWIRNRLRAAKKTAHEVTTGLDIFNVGSKVMGILNEEYLVKLRADTHRGLQGRAERGLAAGGTPYGYRTEEVPSGKVDAHGRSIPAGYRIVIHEEEAPVVRRIFELYLSGDGFRTIAHRLNRENVPSPRPRGAKRRGASWSLSAVRVILTNPLYKGEQVWNRSEWIKDHERGKRRRFERPESDWIRREAPELAIVDRATWDAVRAAMERKRRGYEWRPHGGLVTTHRGAGHPGPARHVLSGLLECGVCHGGFHAANRAGCYACGWRRDRGPEVCSNALRLARVELEARVLGACRERILTPEGLLYAVDRAVAIVRERRRGLDPSAIKARLEEIERELANLRRFAAKTGRIDEAADLHGELDAERRRLHAQLERQPAEPDRDSLRALLAERAAQFQEQLAASPERGRAVLRALFEGRRMRVSPDPERGYRVEGEFGLSLELPETRIARGYEAHRAIRLLGSGGVLWPYRTAPLPFATDFPLAA